MRQILRLVPLFLVATALLASAPAGAASAGSQIVRQQLAELLAVVAQEPLIQGETVEAAVEIKITPGYHVNANPPSEDWLIATEVSVRGPTGIAVGKAFYPQALEKKFDFWETPLRVYEGNVVVGMILEIAADAPLGDRDLEIQVRYQACNDEACFAPVEAKYTVPVTIAPAGTAIRAAPSPLLDRAPFERGKHQR